MNLQSGFQDKPAFALPLKFTKEYWFQNWQVKSGAECGPKWGRGAVNPPNVRYMGAARMGSKDSSEFPVSANNSESKYCRSKKQRETVSIFLGKRIVKRERQER